MITSIKVILDKRRCKNDGSYPVSFQICFQRKTRTRSSKICLHEELWDDNKKEVKKAHPDHKLLNQKLKKQFADIQAELLLADDAKVVAFLKPKDKLVLVPAINVIKDQITVYQFASNLITDLKATNKIGNAWVYESTVNALKVYHPNDDILFEQIDYLFLEAYQKHLLSRKIKPNSIYLYIRTIRIFYNKAIKQKLVGKELYPFDDFKLKPEKTRKRAIDKDLIKQIKDLSLIEDTTIWHVRNWFLLSFYLIGISIIDLALLMPKNYKDGRIEYKRKKTSKWYDIKVVPQAAMIIKLYTTSDGCIFYKT